MHQFTTPAGEVHSLQFAPDGRSLYAISKSPYGSSGIPIGLFQMPFALYQHAYRVDTYSGEILSAWSFSGSEVAIFTPDLRSLYHSVSVAVAGGELDLRRLDLGTGKQCRVYEANVPYPSHMAFTPNGHILAIAGMHYAGDGRDAVHLLDVWHTTELEPIQTQASCLAYSPNGQMLAISNRTLGVQVWRGKSLAEQWPQPAMALAWSLDGHLAWGMSERFAVARPGAREPLQVWAGAGGDVSALTFSPNGRVLLAGTHHGQCTFHDPAAGGQCAAFDWGIGPILSVAFSPDGLTCAAGGEKGQVVVWDVDA